ncbi:MAG TPA: molybdenum cofactor guanylyltransferase MobA [Ottowia sp.]|uniref:molybdenum cofactor guanylyltransferase MobA n=1 Tax=Ottowia sp. TaxID=1898956 RepID=UPI002BF15ACB|nr:molybdenum cofactor guanylyltransferase MobA [Ottowia sp.]HMN21846.1 molybdenum cofactor guanylyltransferase MobA [Ottowia sp.]
MPMHPDTGTPPITALLLAGGRGSRMGGIDKGLQAFRGLPLAAHALQRLRNQTLPPAAIIISANRNQAAYAALGVPVHPDPWPDFQGPLAGFLAGLAHCATPLLLTAACDVPRFPLTLAARLLEALQAEDAEIAMAASPDRDARGAPLLRRQPAFCLLSTGLRASLERFVAGGGRRVDAWTEGHRRVLVPFDRAGDDPNAFANANTLEELRTLEQTP